MTRDKSINTHFSFRPNEIISFIVYDSYDEDDESDTEMTTHVQDTLDTSYILSDELYESSTSVTTESEQSDNDNDEELERYRSNHSIFDSKTIIFLFCLLKNFSDVFFQSKNYQIYVAWEQFDSYAEM